MISRRIVLLGFMGCGKTTVGAEVARRLDRAFTDLDSFITEQDGHSPAEIISVRGEAFFRERETLALREVLARHEAGVIALGGGTWGISANRDLIALHNCVTVWLDVPFELCWQRINAALTVRPLARDRDTARARFQSRRADYKLSEFRILVSESANDKTLAKMIVDAIATG
jgi:shikimate kinase